MKHAYCESLVSGHLYPAEFHHVATFQGGAAIGITISTVYNQGIKEADIAKVVRGSPNLN